MIWLAMSVGDVDEAPPVESGVYSDTYSDTY